MIAAALFLSLMGGSLFEFGRGVIRPWTMLRMARAEVQVKRYQLEAERINTELRKLE